MEYFHVCSDIIFEILTRTSMKTLDASKLVCKLWNQLTFDSNFIQLHSQRTKTMSGYFIQTYKRNTFYSKFISMEENSDSDSDEGLNFDFLAPNVKILASSDQGILCCVSRRFKGDRYYVCKPSTKQLQALPNPKLRFMTVKVALVVLRSNPLRYKIIRLSWPLPLDSSTEYCNYHCEIFDSEIWSWRKLDYEILLPYSVFLNVGHAIFAGGTIHWLTTNDTILGFNEDTEDYTIFPLPQPIRENCSYQHKHLVKYQGRLAFICEAAPPKEHLELWVMEDYRNHAWKKVVEVSMEALRKQEPFCCPSAVALYSGDTALMKSYSEVLIYKFQQCSLNVVNLDQIMLPEEVFAFRSDLEPIDLRGRR